MDPRIEKGKRWFGWAMRILLVVTVVKLLFAFGHHDPGNQIAIAIAMFVVGTVVWGGLGFVLGWATGGSQESGRSAGDTYHPSSAPQTHAPVTTSRNTYSTGTVTAQDASHMNQSPDNTFKTDRHSMTGYAESTVVDDDEIYAAIATELKNGATNEGLWIRLFAEYDGDENRTKVAYIKQRAEKLIAAERSRLAALKIQRDEEAVRFEKIRLEGLSLREQLSSSNLSAEVREQLNRLSETHTATMFRLRFAPTY